MAKGSTTGVGGHSSSAMHSGKLRPGGAPPVWSSTDPHPPVSGAAHVAPGHVTWLQCAVCMGSKLDAVQDCSPVISTPDLLYFEHDGILYSRHLKLRLLPPCVNTSSTLNLLGRIIVNNKNNWHKNCTILFLQMTDWSKKPSARL